MIVPPDFRPLIFVLQSAATVFPSPDRCPFLLGSGCFRQDDRLSGPNCFPVRVASRPFRPQVDYGDLRGSVRQVQVDVGYKSYGSSAQAPISPRSRLQAACFPLSTFFWFSAFFCLTPFPLKRTLFFYVLVSKSTRILREAPPGPTSPSHRFISPSTSDQLPRPSRSRSWVGSL